MATISVLCPNCQSSNVYGHGTTKQGDPRYHCMNSDCPVKTFKLTYRYVGCEPGIDEKIIAMAANASGIRDTARVLGISTDKVMDTLKKQNPNLVRSISIT